VPVGDAAALGRALIGAITDEAARNRVSAKGRALVLEHFTMDTVLSRHLEVLNEMVKTARE
jgi:glycosyltransferase involved in cell wall biosynthesis